MLALALGKERRFSRLNTTVLKRHSAKSGYSWAHEEIMQGIERARESVD
jgi:hypothetical protein